MKLLCSSLIIFLAAVLCGNVQALPGSTSVQARLQSALNLYQVQANSFDDADDTATSTAQCFTLYLPMLNEVAASFSTQYQACIAAANEATKNLTAAATTNQVLYQQEVSELCSAFTACDGDNDTVTFFNCYANAAQSDISVIYDLSTNAANSASTLSQGIKAIQDTEYQCTNTTESNYVRDTAATYDLLDSCLKYGLPTTTVATTTTDDATTTTDSDATTKAAA